MKSDGLSVTIEGEFTTLNQYIDVERGNRFAAAKTKRAESQRAAFAARRLRPIPPGRYDVVCTWYRADRRSDPDNIAFAIKFILDGLQTAGYLGSDRWDWIASITHLFEIDARHPRVEVMFESVDGQR
jgi:hypothetical protein